MSEPGREWLADVVDRWPVVRSEPLAEGTVVTVRRDLVRMPDREEVGREVVEHPGAVGILAMDEAGQVLLIRPARRTWGATTGNSAARTA
jgi:hypothetical protein